MKARAGWTVRWAGLAGAVVLALSMGATAGATAKPATGDLAGVTFSGSGDLTRGWRIQSSAVAGGSGAEISQPGYSTSGWLPISRPQTLMAALVGNGRYPNVLESNNLASVPTDQFKVNWWYRNEVRFHPRSGQHAFLVMNGVLSRANLWVNGVKVADQSQLQGAYSRFEYDVTGHLKDGDNAIALEVFRNDSSNRTGYLTLNMVDWNPTSPDNWTGLQFAPQLRLDGAVSVRNTHVVQNNAADLKASDLTVKTDLHNNTTIPQTTEVTGTVGHGGNVFHVGKRVTVPAGATLTVQLAPIHVKNPKIWWPYQMGGQPLYHLAVQASVNGHRSDHEEEDFGIRTVTSHLTKPTAGKTWGEHGYRQFVINGRPFVVRGAGWSQDLFLRYSAKNVHDQLTYVKNMGLNTIRFEGNFPPDDMFRQMDRMGILAMSGWQCCNKWEQDSSRWNAEIKASAAAQAQQVARSQRDHPSVFTFYQGSDNEPDPAKEAIFLDAFKAADWPTPQVAAAEYKSSAQLGPAGSKEGPYNYAPPAYWWNSGPEMNLGGDFTNAGGAFALDTEAGNGNTIPTQDSLRRFLTAPQQDQIWDVTSTGGKGTGPDIFHTSAYNDYTAVGRLGQYNTPLWNRYGHWSDMASYQRIAQAGGYEVTRAQFEAYLGHSKDADNPSTGLIYWQLNKAWPSLQWELYGYDLDQPGVYFGAKKANEPVHIMYAYDDGSIKVVNLTGKRQRKLQAKAEFIDLDGTVKAVHQADITDLASQDVRAVLRPTTPAGISTTHFLRLSLTDHGRTVSRNVYWLSTKPDQLDWNESVGSGSGAVYKPGGYADLTGLQQLPPAAVQATTHSRRVGGDVVTTVTLRNTAKKGVLYMARADVRRGTGSGRPLGGDDQVLPIQWSDNYVTLWPGESQTITARYARSELRGATPVITLGAWNLPTTTTH